MVKEKAYAKINIGLEVGALREDGYHDMNTIMVPINLYDELTLDQIDEGIQLIDNTSIKVEDNFVYKAAKLFLSHYNITKGVRIFLNKKIPSEAGLGGGSSDAAAVLRGLNYLFFVGASMEELANLAKCLGSDMPYCVYSKLAFCSGRGEIVSIIDINYERRPVAIINPPYGLSTRLVYETGVFDTVNIHKEQFEGIKEFLKTGNLELLKSNLFNELEKPAFILQPDLEELKKKVEALGLVVGMSGSGTSLFVFGDEKKLKELPYLFKYYDIYLTNIM